MFRNGELSAKQLNAEARNGVDEWRGGRWRWR